MKRTKNRNLQPPRLAFFRAKEWYSSESDVRFQSFQLFLGELFVEGKLGD